VIGVHHDGAQAFGAEEQRIHGHLHARGRYFYLQVDLCITTWKKLRVFVRHIDFRQKRSGIGIDSLRGAHHFTPQTRPSGVLRKFEKGSQATPNGWRIRLRHADVNANGVGLGENEKLLLGAAVAGVDQRSGVDVAFGNDSLNGA